MAVEDVIAALKVTGLAQWKADFSVAKDSVSGVEKSTGRLGTTAQQSGGKMGALAGLAGKARFAVAGMAAAAATWTVKEGFKFNQQLDQSRLKFGLFTKSAKETQQVIEGVNAVAKESTFSRPELSAVAAQLGFAGVKAKNLQHDVTGIANAATAVGGTSEKLAQVSGIMGKMALGGKASAEQLNQLADAGLPVYNVLAKKLHLTAGEVQNIGKKGIDSRRIYNALMGTFTSGQMAKAAKTQAESTAGRWHNIIGRLKREAGTLMQPIWDALGTKVFPAIQKGMKPAIAAAKKYTGQTAKDFAKGFSLPPSAYAGYTGLRKVFMDIGHAARLFFDLFQKGGAAFPIVQKAAALFMPILRYIVADLKILWEVAKNLWPVLKLLAIVVGGVLYAAFTLLQPALAAMTWVLKNLMGPAVIFISQQLGNLATVITASLVPAFNWVKNAGSNAAKWVSNAWHNTVSFISSIPGKIASAFRSVVGTVRDTFGKAKDAALDMLRQIPSKALQIGKDIVTMIVNGIKSAPSAIVDAVKSVLPGPLRSVLDKAGGLIHAITGATGHVMAAQTGGIGGGGTILVGERGPELATMPSGTRITPLPPPMLSPSQLMGGGNRPVVTQVFLEKRQIATAVGEFTADQQAAR